MNEIKEKNKTFFVIKVKEHLDNSWEELFEGMNITSNSEVTTISGIVSDQSALHGLLNKVRDWGLTLIAVEQKNQ
jgi:hypothetical protein